MPIAVCVPVGPKLHHQKYLKECLTSVQAQTVKPSEVLIIDDMAAVDGVLVDSVCERVKIYRAPWHIGVPTAFNFGVALTEGEYTLMLGADDTLEPDCIERCEEVISRAQYPENTYFYLPLRYMDTGEEQNLACNAAVVSKSLWKRTGGFPTEGAVGACDTMLISIILAHPGLSLLQSVGDKPLYNYRRHLETDTAIRGDWQQPIFTTRHAVTRDFKIPEWGRYE